MNMLKLIGALAVAVCLPANAAAMDTGNVQERLDRTAGLSAEASSSVNEGDFTAGRSKARNAFEAGEKSPAYSANVVRADVREVAGTDKSLAMSSAASEKASFKNFAAAPPSAKKAKKDGFSWQLPFAFLAGSATLVMLVELGAAPVIAVLAGFFVMYKIATRDYDKHPFQGDRR